MKRVGPPVPNHPFGMGLWRRRAMEGGVALFRRRSGGDKPRPFDGRRL
jgi:hypothetical protein